MYTSFTQLYFQKPIELIEEVDLTNFFSTEQEETLMLEFKSFTQPPAGAPRVSMRDREEAIFKTLCAFANSGGGLLIWGAPREEKSLTNPKTTICKGVLQPVPDYLDRDSYIRKIASNIDPRPQGLRMHRIQVSGGYVYLFEIQESQNKPHQTKGTYYVRIETETNIAPHYLVYALCRQIKVPELEIELKNSKGHVSSYGGNSTWTFQINFELAIYNTTEFANDHDIYMKISTTQGKLWTRPNPEAKKQNLYLKNVVNVLSMGLSHEIQIVHDLEAPLEDEIYVSIWYGGRHSNVKCKKYKLVIGELTGYPSTGYKFAVNFELTES